MGYAMQIHPEKRGRMKSRPIIFDGESVRAILAGTKTQTRRVVKWPITSKSDGSKRRLFGPDDVAEINALLAERQKHPCRQVACPYGREGDELWVRETWLELDRDHYTDPGPRDALSTRYGTPRRNGAAYRAECNAESDGIRAEYGYRWRSPIRMPHWASRLTLRVANVRVERVQEITEADAIAEGVRPEFECDIATFVCGGPLLSTHRLGYKHRWDELNAKRGFGWDVNPFVWVVTFERVMVAV